MILTWFRFASLGIPFSLFVAAGATSAQTTWTRHPVIAPTSDAALVYDRTHSSVLRFGGWESASPIDTFGEWDGSRWLLRTPPERPTERWRHSMAYDAHRGRTVMFGGVTATNWPRETWEWDGRTWLRRAPAASPRSHAYTTLAYDPLRRDVTLFGGDDFFDTWSYTTTKPAQFTPHYVGCASSAGVPVLGGSLPWLGATFAATVAPVPPSSASVLALGFSATTLFGAIPLPLDLTALSMPGCWWYTDIAATLPMTTVSGTARVDLPLPANAQLAGLPFFCQALVLDPPANPLGLVSSNAGAGVPGQR